MELNDLIVLNDKEYTVTLNRQSAVHIERYARLQESLSKMAEPTLEYVDRDIQKGENPFAYNIDEDKMLDDLEKKEKLLISVMSKAFWIWLYPKHQMDYEEIYSIVEEYMQDDIKSLYISEKYNEYMGKSVEIRNNYIDEQKKVRTQATKKN